MSEGKEKFTPGPWEILNVGGIDRYPGIEAPNSCFSVVVFGDDDNDDMGIQGKTKKEALSNAQLIAAAPDMYAALKNCERYLVEKGCSHEYPVLQDLRAALAKARGGSWRETLLSRRRNWRRHD